MADSDLSTSISALKTKIVNGIPTANVNELVSLARAVKALNLGEDKSLEDAINARANALIGSASADDVARLAGAIKQVLNPASITVTTLSTITGDLIPDQNIVHDLGSSTNRFKDLHLSGNTAVIGDSKISDDGTGIDIRDTSGNPRTIKAKEVTIDDGTGNPIKMKRGAGNTIQFLDSSDNSIETQEQASAPAMSAYNLLSQLPTSGVNTGTQAYVAENNKLYLFNGTGWYNIALINNPITAVTGNAATYELANDGTPLSITLSSSDPDGIPLQWSHQVTSGSLGGTTITNVNNVFTITPSTNNSDAGNFTVSFIATNGENQETSPSSFTLTFIAPSPEWDSYTTTADNLQNMPYYQSNREWGVMTEISKDGAYAVISTGYDQATMEWVQIWYDSTGNGSWSKQAEYTSQSGDFGADLAIDDEGITVAIGDSGRNQVKIYKRSGTSWSLDQTITGSNQFGMSTAISGDGLVLAVARPTWYSNRGGIKFYSRADKNTSFTESFDMSDINSLNSTNSYLGRGKGTASNYRGAMEMNEIGTRLVVGCPSYNNGSQSRAYLITRPDTDTNWSNTSSQIKYYQEGGDRNGGDVSISADGNTMVSGGTSSATDGEINIFDITTLPSGQSMTPTQTIRWSQMSSSEKGTWNNSYYFGRAVGINGDGKTIVTSGMTYQYSYINRMGSVYIFRKNDTSGNWEWKDVLEPNPTSSQEDFGTDVGISADGYHIIVGERLATAHSGQSFSHKGSFHVFKATS